MLWIWIGSGAVALVLGFLWAYERDIYASKNGIPMNRERRQMLVDREQRDRMGAF